MSKTYKIPQIELTEVRKKLFLVKMRKNFTIFLVYRFQYRNLDIPSEKNPPPTSQDKSNLMDQK